MLCDGDQVEVLGHKTRIIDAGVEERLMREEPYRAALQSSEHQPLIIVATRNNP